MSGTGSVSHHSVLLSKLMARRDFPATRDAALELQSISDFVLRAGTEVGGKHAKAITESEHDIIPPRVNHLVALGQAETQRHISALKRMKVKTRDKQEREEIDALMADAMVVSDALSQAVISIRQQYNVATVIMHGEHKAERRVAK